jgi:hypothetical protein
MLKVVVGLFLALTAGLLLTGGSSGEENDSPAPQTIDEWNRSALPECIIDLDCGVPGYGGYRCQGEYLVRTYSSYGCFKENSLAGTCVNTSQTELVEQCLGGLECVPGQPTCRPISLPEYAASAAQAALCEDSILDGGETGIDCGGSCPPCKPECERNESCGLPRWTLPYCGEDGSVYRDYVSFECVNPGSHDSHCRHIRETAMSDYCGPKNRCESGACFDGDDRSNFTMPSYKCEEGEPCWTGDEAYVTCRGTFCYTVRIPDDAEAEKRHRI